jgi:hypothetical protein
MALADEVQWKRLMDELLSRVLGDVMLTRRAEEVAWRCAGSEPTVAHCP